MCRSQPAVSQQIKALEDEIGCKLFFRIGKRKLVVTEEGKRLRELAQSLQDDIDRTLEDIYTIGGGSRGQVSISAPFTTCFQILPAVLGPRPKIYPPSCLSFGPSTALHPPAHIYKYALADAPCIRAKIRRIYGASIFFRDPKRTSSTGCIFLWPGKRSVGPHKANENQTAQSRLTCHHALSNSNCDPF